MSDDSAPLNGVPRIGTRRWIAWKMVRLAHRIYNAEYYERIVITGPPDGEDIVEFVICADLYGGGISTMYGPDAFGDGYGVHWIDDFKPDWLTDGDAR